MKKLIILLLVVTGCSHSEQQGEKLTYGYFPDQPVNITLNIVPMEDVVLDMDGMLLELNADYYNRWGISVGLDLMERQSLPFEVTEGSGIFTPEQMGDSITVYIVPSQYVKMGAYAYASTSTKGGYIHRTIVLGDYSQTSSTLAHELGHIWGLSHKDIKGNLMRQREVAWQRGTPKDLEDWQVERIKQNINLILTDIGN